MKLCDLLFHISAQYLNGADQVRVNGISCDSRTLMAGETFICIRGEHTNGEGYVADAILRGASSCVTEDASCVPEGFPCAVVPDARRSLAFMWSTYYSNPGDSIPTVCVTGSCGKTSVARMIHFILNESGIKAGLMGTVCGMIGNETLPDEEWSEISSVPSAMTTPDPKYLYKYLRLMKDGGCKAAVMEASSHAIAQRKLDPISPTLSVFTNLSHEHLDYHGNMESYLAAKARLFRHSRTGVLNGLDPRARHIPPLAPDCHFVLLSDHGGDYRIRDARPGLCKVTYTLVSPKGELDLTVPLPGDFTVENSALAAIAAMELGVSPEDVASALSKMPPIPGRMETVYDGDFTVIRDYAHTLAAMERLLLSLRQICGGRIITVFGCGGDRDRSKRAPMGECATRLSDVTVITSDNSRTENPIDIIEQILRGVHKEKEHTLIPDRREGIEYALSLAGKGDTVVLCGKGHETYEITASGKRPFDERDVVEKFLKKS